MSNIKNIPVSDVVFREDLYPRSEHDASIVQKYVDSLDQLPPIEVNQQNIIIDGKHRWLAHRSAGAETIQATITETSTEQQLFRLAVIRNAKHGYQLSSKDKKSAALNIYLASINRGPDLKKQLAELFSVSSKTIDRWMQDIDRKDKEERNQKIRDLWMAANSNSFISKEVGIHESEIGKYIKKILEKGQMGKNQEFEDSSFQPPLFNVWSWSKKAEGHSHKGNTDVRVVDNLLWLYTEPYDIVVDPFAGGGSTIDICKKRSRRYYVSDLNPIVEREHEIRKHDIVASMPKIPSWKDVAIVYLDPPYWKQAEGWYGDEPENLANMSLDLFHQSMIKIIKSFASKLRSGAKIALIIQPTAMYPSRDEGEFNDHLFSIARNIDLKVVNRIQSPYSTQQHLPQSVTWAKENRKNLVISREIIIWEI